MHLLPDTSAAPRRLINFTPLRYPGGKAKLSGFVKRLIQQNDLSDGYYIEPYAGGAGIALELLFHEYVSHIHINDLCRPVYAFWNCVLYGPDRLCRLIRDTPVDVENWDRQKAIFADEQNQDDLSLGFATFFLNRTNRSGILNGGIIGGRDQTGPWKIDARYNAPELIYRIESIAALRSQISLTRLDALRLLRSGIDSWPEKALIYLDPPYYMKGPKLYYKYYKHDDHAKIADFVRHSIKRQRWIVSYDDVPQIRAIYSDTRSATYDIGYSARQRKTGSEIMFFDPTLTVPSQVGAMRLTFLTEDAPQSTLV